MSCWQHCLVLPLALNGWNLVCFTHRCLTFACWPCRNTFPSSCWWAENHLYGVLSSGSLRWIGKLKLVMGGLVFRTSFWSPRGESSFSSVVLIPLIMTDVLLSAVCLSETWSLLRCLSSSNFTPFSYFGFQLPFLTVDLKESNKQEPWHSLNAILPQSFLWQTNWLFILKWGLL